MEEGRGGKKGDYEEIKEIFDFALDVFYPRIKKDLSKHYEFIFKSIDVCINDLKAIEKFYPRELRILLDSIIINLRLVKRALEDLISLCAITYSLLVPSFIYTKEKSNVLEKSMERLEHLKDLSKEVVDFIKSLYDYAKEVESKLNKDVKSREDVGYV